MKKSSNYRVVFSILLIGSIVLLYLFRDSSPSPLESPPLLTDTTPIEAPQEKVAPSVPEVKMFQYIEVVDGCDTAFVGLCVNMRSGPGLEYPVIERLRTGIVLKVSDIVEVDGHTWYKISLDKNVLYTDRITGDLYIYADVVELFTNEGDKHSSETTEMSDKRIVVDLSEQILYAYDSDSLFMTALVSTGLKDTPTPRGTFSVFKKTPSRYMQGPLPGVSEQVYDLPGVPWDLYFTKDGAVIHGTYWHDHFGRPWSHGCVNLSPQDAKKLYMWADLNVKVIVQD